MILGYQKTISWVICLVMIPAANLQIPISVYPMMPQIYALPPPPPIVIPYPIPVPYRIKDPTTKTTTPKTTKADVNQNKKIYVAIPAPYPVPVPAYGLQPPPMPYHPGLPPPLPTFCFKSHPRPKNCPQCPPYLPPPVLPPVYPFLPFPVIRPPPVLIVPFPPPIQLHRGPALYDYSNDYSEKATRKSKGCKCGRHSSCLNCKKGLDDSVASGSSDDSYDSDGSENSEDLSKSNSGDSNSAKSNRKHKKKVGHVRRKPIRKKSKMEQEQEYRRNQGHRRSQYKGKQGHNSDGSNNAVVKPVFSYISEDGDAKIKQRISRDEALELMNEDRTHNVPVMAGEDYGSSEKLHITSNRDMDKFANDDFHQREVLMKPRSSQLFLGGGKKEIIFRTPKNKKIGNISVSFQFT